MSSIPQTSGIYRIVCSANGKIYIGSAVNLRHRKKDHFKTLRGNRHANIRLQRAWNKYGEDAFSFEVIEWVLAPFLLEREQYWMDKLRVCDDRYGFNIAPLAGSCYGAKRPHTSAAIRTRREQTWIGFVNPNGEPVTIVNLWRFCKKNGLHFGAMWNLANGKGRTKSYKGWRFQGNDLRGRFCKEYCGFIDPDGNQVQPVINLAAFCRERGLHPSHMRDVYNGKTVHHHGWTCRRVEEVEVAA